MIVYSIITYKVYRSEYKRLVARDIDISYVVFIIAMLHCKKLKTPSIVARPEFAHAQRHKIEP